MDISKAFNIVTHNISQNWRDRDLMYGLFRDEELVEWSHPESSGQHSNVQMKISDESCSSGVHTRARTI